MDFFKKENNEIKNEINMLPMIDVIFAILSFFIISSLYLTKVETIPLNLPKASSSKKEDQKSINLSIDSQSRIYINKELIEISNIKQKIGSLSSDELSLVIIRGDKEVNYGKIVEVLDIVRNIKNIKIAISTEPK